MIKKYHVTLAVFAGWLWVVAGLALFTGDPSPAVAEPVVPQKQTAIVGVYKRIHEYCLTEMHKHVKEYPQNGKYAGVFYLSCMSGGYQVFADKLKEALADRKARDIDPFTGKPTRYWSA